MRVVLWQHRLDTCDCPSGCRYGYSWVVEVDGVVVHHGEFTLTGAAGWLVQNRHRLYPSREKSSAK